MDGILGTHTSRISDAQRQLNEVRQRLNQRDPPRQRAATARELRERGFYEITRDLEWEEVYRSAPWQDQVIFDIGESVGANDVARAGTGQNERAQDLSTWDRVVAGGSGALNLLNAALTPVLGAAVLRQTGRGVMVEIAPGVFRKGIRMPKAWPGQSRNAAGYLRNSKKFWHWMLEEWPELFSDNNAKLIREGLAPTADAPWIKEFPEHELLKDDILVHHHWDKGADTIGVPDFLHRLWHGELHYF